MARILVVEDEAIVAADIKDMLERTGHVVTHTAASGEDALRKTEQARPDLVLMDIVLRGDMDGVAAAERIRERFRIPVVYLTAYADDTTLQRAKLTGPFGYVLKPFEERDLRTTIEVALHAHGMERKLRESEARLHKAAEEWELTFDAMESPIFILDAERRIVRLNRAAKELAGPAASEEAAGDIAEMGPGEPWCQAARLATAAQQTRSAAHGQVRDAPSGRTWDLTAGPSPGPSGSDERVLVVARDITPMVELQDSLRRSETMSALGLLLAGVAHEVRNPLFSISANLDAFEAEFGARSEFAELAALMRAEVERLAALMRGLLEYGRPAESPRQPGAIEAVVEEAVERCAGLASRSGVRVVNGVAPGSPPLLMDQERVVQACVNLLQNAIQHSAPEGVVHVGAAREHNADGAWLVLEVSDAGPGFAAEDLPRVFEPFFSRRRGGTGLGLAIALRIVEEHGGTLSAANRPEGGARMVVRLPWASRRDGASPDTPV